MYSKMCGITTSLHHTLFLLLSFLSLVFSKSKPNSLSKLHILLCALGNTLIFVLGQILGAEIL